jgi:PAS domain S-box-containing protein
MEQRALILLLEDCSDDAELIERELRQGGIAFTASRVESEAAYARCLKELVPDLVLADFRLSGFDGMKALAMARRELPDVPVVMMSGVAGEELAVEALRNGATDYVLKDRLYRLAPSVRRALELAARRRTERAARETERKFFALTETLPAIVFVHQHGRFCYLNPAAEAILGYPPAQLLARNFWEVIHPDFRDLVRGRGLGRQLGDPVPMRYEFPIVTRGGETRWLDCTATRIEFDGQAAVLGSAFDITERVRAEEALRLSEQRFRVLVDAMPDLIFRLASDGTILDFKSPKDAHLGTGAGELLCGALLDKAATLLAESPGTFLGRILETGAVQSFQFRFPLREELRDFEARVTVCGAGEVLAIVSDITERRRMEEEILEISARERRRIGHDLHDGLGQYLAAIAVKIGVLEHTLAAESSPHASAAKKIVTLLSNAVGQTRDLARGLDPIDLETNGLVSALQTLARETGDLFHVECDFRSSRAGFPVTRFVALQLYRIAQEGIHNAVQHGKPRRVKIGLAAAGGHIQLRIRDDGRGFRPDASNAMGMGLRIMHHRAHVVGGVLRIQSRPRSGTVIECLVPLAPPGSNPPPESRTDRENEGASGREPTPGPPMPS